ncbi:uncharacterized protein LOC111101803 isoform X1 [Crassostrea virginica]
MVRVKQCPRNLTEVLAASSKLRCGRDVYGNSQYMCLPNVQKSSLVEFCYGDVMGMQEKGNCLEVSEGELFLKSCTTFENGCPKEHFKNTDFYKYPACQIIDTIHNCYKSESSCHGENIKVEVDGARSLPSDFYIFLIYIVILFLLLIFVVLFSWRRKQVKNVQLVQKCKSGMNKT